MRAIARLGAMRARAESRMGAVNGGSTATVWREDPDNNPVVVDGLETPSWVAELTSLPGRLAANRGASQSRTVTIGQTEVQLAVREWHCPAGTALHDGDVIEVTSGEHAGTYLRVIESNGSDQATALRVPVIETQKPEGLT